MFTLSVSVGPYMEVKRQLSGRGFFLLYYMGTGEIFQSSGLLQSTFNPVTHFAGSSYITLNHTIHSEYQVLYPKSTRVKLSKGVMNLAIS